MNMPILAQFGNSEQKMLSKDLLDLINQVRTQFNEKPVRLNDFNSRIADELDGENYETFVVQNFNNTESIFFELTIDQCMLIGMRESKGVRKNVLAILKEKQKPFDITNPAHLLQAIEIQAKQNIALTQERDHAIATKAEIGSRREATAMGRLSAKVKEVESLKVQLDKSLDFASIKSVEIATGRKFGWHALKKWSKSNSSEIKTIPDPNFGEVKTYHKDAWLAVYNINLSSIRGVAA